MPDIEFLGLRQHLGLFLPDVVLHTFRQHGELCVAMVRRCLGIQFGYQQLKQFLASLARDLKEERVYLRAGETASLIYPKD